MMIGWTTYGASLIDGVQGRYLIPVLLPALAGLRSARIRVYFSEKSRGFFYAMLEVTEIILVMNLVSFPLA